MEEEDAVARAEEDPGARARSRLPAGLPAERSDANEPSSSVWIRAPSSRQRRSHCRTRSHHTLTIVHHEQIAVPHAGCGCPLRVILPRVRHGAIHIVLAFSPTLAHSK